MINKNERHKIFIKFKWHFKLLVCLGFILPELASTWEQSKGKTRSTPSWKNVSQIKTKFEIEKMFCWCTYSHGLEAGLIWSSSAVVFQNWHQRRIERHKKENQHPSEATPCSRRRASWMRWPLLVLRRCGNRCSCPMSRLLAVTPYKRALWHRLAPVLSGRSFAWPYKHRCSSSSPSRLCQTPSSWVMTPILASCCSWHFRFPCICCSRWTRYCSWQPWLCWFFLGPLQN